MDTPNKFDWRAARAALAGSAALLLPFLAAADSQLAVGSAGERIRSTAHLDFKIVIPRVLSLEVGTQTVAIYSNSRYVALGSTVRASDKSRGGLVLSAAARKIIEQNVPCGAAAPAASMICTASMP